MGVAKNKVGRAGWNDKNREATFDPVVCSMQKLEDEIRHTNGQRKAFLMGVRQVRAVLCAAGAIS